MRFVLALVVTLITASASGQTLEPLFVHTTSRATAGSAPGDQRDTILSRSRVGIRLDVLFDQRSGAARQLLLNAGGELWTARFERLEFDTTGFRSWVGTIEGIANSHVVFTERDGVVSGLINAVGTTYQIRTESPGRYLIERVNLAALGDERDPIREVSSAGADPRIVTAADDSPTIDVLMLYTPAARSKVGDTAQISALASQAIADTNTAFIRSNVRARVRLLGTFELAYVEAPLMTSDLPAVKSSADARLLRDVMGADLVQLLVSSPDLSSCGIGYLLSPETLDFDAYSIADVSCMAQYTPTHEMAHNLGSHHAPEDGASGALFSYSYAYKDPARGFRTVMAYPCLEAICDRIPNFSNPEVGYNGAVTGTAVQDNARSINDAASYVAGFRTAGVNDGTPPAAPSGLRSTVNGNTVTVSWNPVAPADPASPISYVLQAGTSPGASDLFNASVGPVTSVSGALWPGTYYWRVIAVNAAGAGAPSSDQQFVIGGCGPPSAPVDFRFAVGGRDVTLTWNAPATGGAVSYLLEAGSAPTLANLLVAPVGSQTTIVTPAPPGTYYVRVRAQNACGTSQPSNEQTIVVP
jgi:hypothetical protein